MPCQCTSAGACQNIRNSGVCSGSAISEAASIVVARIAGRARGEDASWRRRHRAGRVHQAQHQHCAHALVAGAKGAEQHRGHRKAPFVASAVAAMKPSVAAGTSIRRARGPRPAPATRTTAAMYRKNRPASASGCLRNVRMPSLTHWMPVRAGTTLSFMARHASPAGSGQRRWRSTRSKCAGSCGLSSAASRGRWQSHSREIQKRSAAGAQHGGQRARSAGAHRASQA